MLLRTLPLDIMNTWLNIRRIKTVIRYLCSNKTYPELLLSIKQALGTELVRPLFLAYEFVCFLKMMNHTGEKDQKTVYTNSHEPEGSIPEYVSYGFFDVHEYVTPTYYKPREIWYHKPHYHQLTLAINSQNAAMFGDWSVANGVLY
ncbi:hypothetical protein PROFUN_16225 [Planoprotostelium fungivorum]|uniref:Uncharacterized protein n=1 Tax=Planoprotostelium fungivorum TaxID=1890364 RepID=A0A2P6MS23_9EUKA|nr:hypothetical protein PROFUN_16225 [Planoprotostelium fungivorum]